MSRNHEKTRLMKEAKKRRAIRQGIYTEASVLEKRRYISVFCQVREKKFGENKCIDGDKVCPLYHISQFAHKGTARSNCNVFDTTYKETEISKDYTRVKRYEKTGEIEEPAILFLSTHESSK